MSRSNYVAFSKSGRSIGAAGVFERPILGDAVLG
jgi:hypothetical protein